MTAPRTWTMPLAEVLERYQPAYGGTWEGARTLLLEYPWDAETVAVVRADLQAGKGIREPIRLYEDDETGELSIGNGMHRLVAAWLEGVDMVPVTDDQDPEEIGETYKIEFLTDLDEDTVFGAFRSFTIHEKWAECLTLGSHLQKDGTVVYDGYWIWDGNVDDFLLGLHDRARHCKTELTVVFVRVGDEDDEELEP